MQTCVLLYSKKSDHHRETLSTTTTRQQHKISLDFSSTHFKKQATSLLLWFCRLVFRCKVEKTLKEDQKKKERKEEKKKVLFLKQRFVHSQDITIIYIQKNYLFNERLKNNVVLEREKYLHKIPSHHIYITCLTFFSSASMNILLQKKVRQDDFIRLTLFLRWW